MKAGVTPCPFDQWCLDIVGSFPLETGKIKFSLVAIDYFSKWIEVESLTWITEDKVLNFLRKDIVCYFGIPRTLISDNGRPFCVLKTRAWCGEMKIDYMFTLIAYRQSNSQVEVTNRTIVQQLKVRLWSSKDQWMDETT